MKNNFCEEQKMSKDIGEFHEAELSKKGIPKWANVKCPFCHKNLPLRSIRNIAFLFNTRNMGDIAVEVYCEDCCLMDTMYFRQEFNTVEDILLFLRGDKNPSNQPIIEEDMYKLKYNNVVEKMIIGGKK